MVFKYVFLLLFYVAISFDYTSTYTHSKAKTIKDVKIVH